MELWGSGPPGRLRAAGFDPKLPKNRAREVPGRLVPGAFAHRRGACLDGLRAGRLVGQGGEFVRNVEVPWELPEGLRKWNQVFHFGVPLEL